MKKLFLAIVLCSTQLASLYAQNAVHEYRFNGTLNEKNNAGPTLIPLCTGQYVNDTLTDFGTLTRPVYHFDQNCGFYYDDSINNFLASGSYTIELYFKMSTLNSWKRVIDFKSRTADAGCYVYNGQLNFYPVATSSGAPFAAKEYSHYVITRNNATKQILMYGDGNNFINFTDNTDMGVYDARKKLRFFQDDLVIAGEASDGNIGLLRIYNYPLDSTTIKTIYNGLGGALGVAAAAHKVAVSVAPNPANDMLTVTLPGNATYQYAIIDITGRRCKEGTLKGRAHLNVTTLPAGVYWISVSGADGVSAIRKFIKQ